MARLAGIWPQIGDIAPAIAAQVAVDARYASYVERQELDVAACRKDEALGIPAGFDFDGLPGSRPRCARSSAAIARRASPRPPASTA